jgi:uncharacterized membrane protein YadS
MRRLGIFFLLMFACTYAQAAIDSYRFLHVTIETPWYIFLFLLMGVFSPFVLMAVLVWHNAIRKDREDVDSRPPPPPDDKS